MPIEVGRTGKKKWFLCKGKKFFYEPGNEKDRRKALLKARARDQEKLVIIGR